MSGRRKPPRSEVITRADGRVYLRRWRLWRGRFFSVCLHRFMAPDQSACAHDHPWPFVSLVLWGGYVEEVWPDGDFRRGGARPAGAAVARVARRAPLPPGGGVPPGLDVDAGPDGAAAPQLGVPDPGGGLGARGEVRCRGGLLTGSVGTGDAGRRRLAAAEEERTMTRKRGEA